MKKLSFVVPVYRNEGSLRLTYQKITSLFQGPLASFAYEFVFVNDGSDDGSLAELHALAAEDPAVRVYSFVRNFGQVAAVIAGLRQASGDWVVNLSADLQDPPELVVSMMTHAQRGNEVVICQREGREDAFLARVTSAIFYRLMRVGIRNMPRGGFDYLLFSRKALDLFNQLDGHNRFFQGDVLWLGLPTAFLPYKRQKRTIGKSQWTLGKKLKYFIDGVVTTSYWPIRLMSFTGGVIASAGFVYALVIVVARLFNNVPFKGWAPLMIVVLLIGGLLMVMLGIIGEYTWRTFDEVRRRPLYLFDESSSLSMPTQQTNRTSKEVRTSISTSSQSTQNQKGTG